MMIEIKGRETSEKIPCPENTVLLGLTLRCKNCNLVNINNATAEVCDVFHAVCQTVMERQWGDVRLKLLFYTTNDPKYRAICRRYAGLPMLHFCYRDLEITATL